MEKNKGGRLGDPIWERVSIDEKDVYCNDCEGLIHSAGKSHVSRVRTHFTQRCVKRIKTTQTLITQAMLPTVSPSEQASFTTKIALWVYSTGMPFYKLEHATFADAIRVISPDIVVPSRADLASTLLEIAYQNSIAMIKRIAAGQRSTLTTDGWTDINGKAVLNYVAIVGSQSFFLETHYTGGFSHDAKYLSADLERVMKEHDYLKICGATTDNTSANQLMWKKLQDKYPKLFLQGCVCHALHLLTKDIVAKMPWLQKLLTQCKELFVLVKKTHGLKHELAAESKATALVLPGDTRWCSIVNCFRSVLGNEPHLFKMVHGDKFLAGGNKENKFKRRRVYDLLRGKDFQKELKLAIALLEKIAFWTTVFQGEGVAASDVYAAFLKLPTDVQQVEGLTAKQSKEVVGLINARFEFIYADVHGVAYVLDPRHMGKGMDADTHSKVETFIGLWNGPDKVAESLTELAAYNTYIQRLADGRTPSPMLQLVEKRKISPFSYWCGLKDFPCLKEIALQVFSTACSSSSAERSFSAQAFIHSRLRNRLEKDRVQKLLHIFQNQKDVDQDELEFYCEFAGLQEDEEVTPDAPFDRHGDK